MATDSFGAWAPEVREPQLVDNSYIGAPGGGIYKGVGAPGISTPVTAGYIDKNTGNFYTNPTGVAGAWVLVGTSGGGNPQQLYTANYADPNVASLVPADPTKGALFQQDPNITLYNLWAWSVTAQTWKQTVSPS